MKTLKRNWLTSIMFFAFCLCSCDSQSQIKSNLGVSEFEHGIRKNNIQLLDVRTQEEYNSGHIKDALLADWTKKKIFIERVQHLEKDKPVYVYCLSGGRSSAAVAWLQENGFKEVYNLEGGITAWKKNNKPVESIQKVQQMSMEEFERQLPTDKTVLVDIGAAWCPPCKKMDPVIDDLVKTNGALFRLIKIDGGKQEILSRQLGAESFPTFIVYKNGKEVWRKEGLATKEELLQQLQ